MRVLICGGTGFLGRHIVNALVQLGHDPVVRSRHSDPSLDFAQLHTPQDWMPHLQGIDAVINAVGALRNRPDADLQTLHMTAPAALFDACAQAGIRRVVQVSALGADKGDTLYATSKRAADDYLLALGQAGELNPAIVRPSIIFGEGGASSKLFILLAQLPVLPLPQIMRGSKIQPVAVGDVAQAVAQLATTDAVENASSGVMEIGGPQALSIERFIATLRAQMQYRPATVRMLPHWLSNASAKLGDQISWMPWCSEAMALLEHDNVTDPATLRSLLGREPKNIYQMVASLPKGGRFG